MEPGKLSVDGYKQAIQVAGMARSRGGWIKLGQIEKSALCHLEHADFAKVVPVLFYIYDQAWKGKVDYGADVKLPEDLPDHWKIKIPAGDSTWEASDTATWKATYQCARLLELEGPPPDVKPADGKTADVKPDEDKTAEKAPPRRNGNGSTADREVPAAEAECKALGGTFAAGACSLPTGQSELDTGAGDVPADKSYWPLAIAAGVGVAVIAGIVVYFRKKRGQ